MREMEAPSAETEEPSVDGPSPKRQRLYVSENCGPNIPVGEAAEAAVVASGLKTPPPPPAGAEAHATTPGLTPEQRERIERNRRLAQERLQKGGGAGGDEKEPGGLACEGKGAVDGQDAAPPAGGLTAEQLGRIERSRLAAMERRRAEAAKESPPEAPAGGVGGAVGLTAEQRDRVERQRLAALERRRQQQEADGAGDAKDAAAGQRPPLREMGSPSGDGAAGPRAAPNGEMVLGDTTAGAAPGSPAPSSPELPPIPLSPSLDSVSMAPSSPSAPPSPRGPHEDSEGDSSSSSSSSSSESSDEEEEPDEQPPEQPGGEEPTLESGSAGASCRPGAPDGGGAESSDSDSDESSDAEPEDPQAGDGLDAPKPLPTPGDTDIAASQCCEPRLPDYRPARAAVPAAKAPRERTSKQALVAQLLCRWWYVLPDWPPKDFDFEAVLHKRGYRCVAVERFHLEPELDELGREKVFAVAGYPGLFRSAYGQLIDARPVEGRPSYDQLMLRSETEVHRLVVAAYERQIEVLEAQPPAPEHEELGQELRRELTKVKRGSLLAMFMSKPREADAGAEAAKQPAPMAPGGGGGGGLTAEQRERIERQRLAALERRRKDL